MACRYFFALFPDLLREEGFFVKWEGRDGVRKISLEIHYNFRTMDESKTHNLSDYAEANSVAKAV